MACIETRGLRKTFGSQVALDGLDLEVEDGAILGVIGPNGAGKSTALHAILGLLSHEGSVQVLGRDPWSERDLLMRDAAFIPDVAVLPRWMRVSWALDYAAGVNPRFDPARAKDLLATTHIGLSQEVRQLSKGMVAQLHLALVLATDARLVVLDEPTRGLDMLFVKRFYDSLLADYLDRSRTIVIATHEVENVQDILTHLLFIDRGRALLQGSLEELEERYCEVRVRPEALEAARALQPIHERRSLGGDIFLFEEVDRERLADLGDTRPPSVADLFMAVTSASSRPGRAGSS